MSAALVRQHYTKVCHCEWAEDEMTRTMTSEHCSIHGNVPDPLDALAAENERLRQAEDRLLVAREAFNTGDYDVMEDALRG